MDTVGERMMSAVHASTLRIDNPTLQTRSARTGARTSVENRKAEIPLWTGDATAGVGAPEDRVVAAFIDPDAGPLPEDLPRCPSDWCDDRDVGTLDHCVAGVGGRGPEEPGGYRCVHRFDPSAAGAPCTRGQYCCSDGRMHRRCPDTGDSCPTWWCNDSDSCTIDLCSNKGASCRHEPVECDDGNPCTDDSCDPLLGCRHFPNRLSQPCYTGPDLTASVGTCTAGERTCRNGRMSACVAENTPKQEKCNGRDDDCDGDVDESDAAGCTVFHRDEDRDGHGQAGDQNTRCLCEPTAPWTAVQAGDCNDGLAAIRPGGEEACGDGIDGDCDGRIDEDCR